MSSDTKRVLRRSRADKVIAGVAGGLAEFTGISSPYEEPEFADLTIDTESRLEECTSTVFDYIAASTNNGSQ